MQNGITTSAKSLEVSHKVKYTLTTCISCHATRYLFIQGKYKHMETKQQVVSNLCIRQQYAGTSVISNAALN